jgi:hypothetical protein
MKVDWNDVKGALILIFVLGLVLIFLGRPFSEGFESGGGIQCGVDKAPCPGFLKCVNGFCAATEPKREYEKNAIPLLPDGASLPYF